MKAKKVKIEIATEVKTLPVKDGDVVLVRAAGTKEYIDNYKQLLRDTFPKNTVLLVNKDTYISVVSEESMNKMGWFRKSKK